MNKFFIITLIGFFGFVNFSCERNPIKGSTTEIISKHELFIQPLGKVNKRIVWLVDSIVQVVYGYNCVILPETKPTRDIFAPSKTKIDGNKLLDKYTSTKHVLIITNIELSHFYSKDYPEWSIWGLGQQRGNAAVVSTYLLKSYDWGVVVKRVLLVSLHELGHNLGLKHCPNKSCIMNSGQDGVSQLDAVLNISFCDKCKSKFYRGS